MTVKSGRKYNIYSVMYGNYGFKVLVKVRFIFLWFIPIWRYLKDNGSWESSAKIIDFSTYEHALKYILDLEKINETHTK